MEPRAGLGGAGSWNPPISGGVSREWGSALGMGVPARVRLHGEFGGWGAGWGAGIGGWIWGQMGLEGSLMGLGGLERGWSHPGNSWWSLGWIWRCRRGGQGVGLGVSAGVWVLGAAGGLRGLRGAGGSWGVGGLWRCLWWSRSRWGGVEGLWGCSREGRSGVSGPSGMWGDLGGSGGVQPHGPSWLEIGGHGEPAGKLRQGLFVGGTGALQLGGTPGMSPRVPLSAIWTPGGGRGPLP